MEWSSSLEIRDVGVTDFGEYTCHAQNSLGHSVAHYTLRPPKPPETPINLTVSSCNITLVLCSQIDIGNNNTCKNKCDNILNKGITDQRALFFVRTVYAGSYVSESITNITHIYE